MPESHRALLRRVLVTALIALAAAFACCASAGCSDAQRSSDGYTLVEDGVLTVASDLATPPFEYTDEAGMPQGFTYELMGMIADELGLALNYLPAQKFDSIIPMTKQGVKTDVGACNITINEERLEEVDFTDPYMDSNQGVATVSGSGYDTVESLNAPGVRIAVQAGTTSEEWAIENIPDATTVNFDDWTAAFTAVMSGQCQGVVCDLPVEQWLVSNSFTTMQIIEEVPTGEQFGIAVSKDNPELTAAIDEALAAIRADGRYDALYEQWFGVAPSSASDTGSDGQDASGTPETLEVMKASASANEDGGTAVLGGIATRLTWEATVGADGDVGALALTLPDGGSFEDSDAHVYAVDDLTRTEIDCSSRIDSSTLVIELGEPARAGTDITVEVDGVLFPSQAGAYTIGGTYSTVDGEVRDLPESPTIAVSESTVVQQAVQWLDAQPWVAAWNENPFLGMFLRPQHIVTSLASLSQGWGAAILVTVIGFPLAIPLAFVITFMKISRYRALRAVAITYINVLRGTPLFLQIYIAFFGFPMLGLNVPNLPLGIGVLAINCSAYLAEIFRAGIESIPRGQFEAAQSQGFGFLSTMWLIILPQTVRRVIPTMTSELVMLYKDTSLLSSVGVMELMMFSKNLTATTGNITPYIVAALYYLVVTIPLIYVIGRVERKIGAETGRR